MDIDPNYFRAVLFDLDGVLTETTSVHREAWKRAFDEFLDARPHLGQTARRPFTDADYREHVDGKRREDGVVDFLGSRGVEIPLGTADDAPGDDTAHGLGKRKDSHFVANLCAEGVRVLDGAIALLTALRHAGVRTAVISASRNCRLVLSCTHLEELFDARVDRVLADDLDLPGKPHPATFLEAAHRLGTTPAECVVVEDSAAGVRAGRRGHFGLVVGVHHDHPAERLFAAGAHAVVTELPAIRVLDARGQRWISSLPDVLALWPSVAARISGHRLLVALDFDGTLAPVQEDPAEVVLPPRTRRALQALRPTCSVAVLSGRELRDIRARVGVDGIYYGGSHGCEAATPSGELLVAEGGQAAAADLETAHRDVVDSLNDLDLLCERKEFGVAVHYRDLDAEAAHRVVRVVTTIAARFAGLELLRGRSVLEIVPAGDWNKGTALRSIAEHTGAAAEGGSTIYVGDDDTDETALHAVQQHGIGITVRSEERGNRLTWARYTVSGPPAVAAMLERLASRAAPRQEEP